MMAEAGNPVWECELPLRTVSLANAREHWSVRSRRGKKEKQAVLLAMKTISPIFCDRLPTVVTLTRIGKRALDDDNLSGSFKAIRDQIAKCMSTDDSPGSNVKWLYEQRKSKDYSIHIHIEVMP